MEKKKLPEGVQLFRKIRNEGYYYVDKTGYIHMLTQLGNPCIFLSRPRRFGKSLFVDTLHEAFSGNEELFRGLILHDKWDWSKRHPVIRLDYSAGIFSYPDGLRKLTVDLLRLIEKEAGLDASDEQDPVVRLRQLVANLYEKTGQSVVLLVDEYDKPILDTIKDIDLATSNRDMLGGMFGINKQMSKMLRFTFITGVSRFAKTSLFSGVNNLKDITIDSNYSAICGYTEADLDSVFAPELDGLNREKIREWYNGYNWLGKEMVYNPYDILNHFETGEFQPWWFKTGLPSFLVKVLADRNVMSVELDRPLAHGELIESFDVDNIDPTALLFQTGYLTIDEKIVDEEDEVFYRLDYPNREVRQYLNRILLNSLDLENPSDIVKERSNLLNAFRKRDKNALERIFQTLLSGIPKQWHSRVDLTQYEAYFASVYYSYFAGTGLLVQAEVATNRGRIDLAVTGPSWIYLFEIKMVNGKRRGSAMRQIVDIEYVQRFRGLGKPIYLAGIEISKKTHNIVEFDLKKDDGEAA